MMKREELSLEDEKMIKEHVGVDTLVRVEHKQVMVVDTLTNHKYMVRHSDGTKYWVSPRAMCSIPESLAIEFIDREGAYVLSKAEAQKYIDKAKEMILDMNKDIIEFNTKVKAHNEKVRRGDLDQPLWTKKKMRRSEDISPYKLFMAELGRKQKPKKKDSKKKE